MFTQLLHLTKNARYILTGFVDSEDETSQIIRGDWRAVIQDDEGGLTDARKIGGNRATHLMLANVEKTSKITLAVKKGWQLGNGNMSESVILYILNAPLSKF